MTEDHDWEERIRTKYASLFEGYLFGRTIEVRSGWYPVVEWFCEKLLEFKQTENNPIQIHQIKEKFGELTIYLGYNDDSRIDNLIRQATEKSRTVCEICSSAGQVRYALGWNQTLCDTHYEQELNKEKAD